MELTHDELHVISDAIFVYCNYWDNVRHNPDESAATYAFGSSLIGRKTCASSKDAEDIRALLLFFRDSLAEAVDAGKIPRDQYQMDNRAVNALLRKLRKAFPSETNR